MTARSCKSIAVFLGPTLCVDQARALLDADYYPPARKGDVYRIMASGVKTIVLIDGVFHNTPSVWQRELLNALEDGIQVLGASSMGALRAAELHRFGMKGHGVIFKWYRDGVIDGDDEVALWHGPEEFGFRPLSEPLVNIRYTLLKAVKDHCLTREQARELTEYARQLHYPERSYSQLLNSPVAQSWPRAQLARLERYFLKKSVDLKRDDAIGVLRHCAGTGKRRGGRMANGLQRSSRVRDTWGWGYARLLLSGFFGPRGVVTGEQVLNEAYKDSALMRPMRPLLSKRYFLSAWARQNGVTCPEEFLNSFIRQWAEEHPGFGEDAWLRANGLTPTSYEMLLAERALIQWLTIQSPAYFGREKSLILEWAEQNGISLEPNGRDRRVGRTEAALEKWIVKRGASYFGFSWRFQAALLRELQLTGRAAELAEKAAAR
ncbi:MAG: hypothetical protein H7Y30_05440 [Pyrinomonadaceae bacterium]|nr:hypothetical protein [Pyrinomonadaceae bacterium]